jgi:hypothetical protein
MSGTVAGAAASINLASLYARCGGHVGRGEFRSRTLGGRVHPANVNVSLRLILR